MDYDSWSAQHLSSITSKAGERYSPRLNIGTSTSELFDDMSRSKIFYTNVRKKYGNLIREFRRIDANHESETLQEHYNNVASKFSTLLETIGAIKEYSTATIPWDSIAECSKKLVESLRAFTYILQEEEIKESNKVTDSKDNGTGYRYTLSERYKSDRQHCYRVMEMVNYFFKYSTSSAAELTNNPFLLLTGSAGSGKTHLLCDLIENRINGAIKLPTFLVFGELFSNSDNKDFWSQFIEQLNLENTTNNKEGFLHEINQLGKERNCRSLIIIDALNENILHSPLFWKNNITSILSDIKKYPNIGFVISIRGGFEEDVLTEDQKKEFTLFEHKGFLFKEWEAIYKFFSEFSLPLPELPLLVPEFQNPLFLLLFCKAFKKKKNKQNKQIFRGHEGATYIFENFVDSVSEKIADTFSIPNGSGKNIWDLVIEKVAESMVQENSDFILEDKLIEIIRNAFPHIEGMKLIIALENNMLLTKIPYNKTFRYRFPFQKFSDHLIGRFIFKKYEAKYGKQNKNITTAIEFFSKDTDLGTFLFKHVNIGIIQALSIQCPEHLKGIEFIEVLPYFDEDPYFLDIMKEAFVESIIWRNPKAFSKDLLNTLRIVNDHIITSTRTNDAFLNALLTISQVPTHPFNAQFLYKHLNDMDMPDRDAWWSSFLHREFENRSAVDRILGWVNTSQASSVVKEEALFLISVTLSWFLTSSNRYIRDKATKGLVIILNKNIAVLYKLLKRFEDTNDLYVLERLCAVAYGCALLNKEDSLNLKILGEYLYSTFFITKSPLPHILIRDYARGTIEAITANQIVLDIEVINTIPPYKSLWPKEIPTEEELKTKYYVNKDYSAIWSSLMYKYGGFPADFGNYVVSSSLGAWTNKSLESLEIAKEKLLEKFLADLNEHQKESWKKISPFYGLDLASLFKDLEIQSDKLSNKEELKENLHAEKDRREKAITNFKAALSSAQCLYFEKELQPYLNENLTMNDPTEFFDTGIAQRWILNRVIELGFDPSIHNDFDNSINYGADRTDHKAERIGKKYQWIAFHEFIALVSDHFAFRGERLTNNSEHNYEGPWIPYIRDIDPSFIIKDDTNLKRSINLSDWKKKYLDYSAWLEGKTYSDWLTQCDDMPDIKHVINLSDDNNNEWFTLEGNFTWEEEVPPEHEKYTIATRAAFYLVKSYLVKKEDSKRFYTWGEAQDFMGNWMPQSNNFYEVFLGEYPNSLAFNNIRDDYNVNRPVGDENIPVIVTDDIYLNEFTLDCSYNHSISIHLPSKWLVEQMSLKQQYTDGRFFDESGELVAMPYNIFDAERPSMLLINKDKFSRFLDKKGYSIFWICQGKKHIIGGDRTAKEGRVKMNGIFTLNDKGKIIGKLDRKFLKD